MNKSYSALKVEISRSYVEADSLQDAERKFEQMSEGWADENAPYLEEILLTQRVSDVREEDDSGRN